MSGVATAVTNQVMEGISKELANTQSKSEDRLNTKRAQFVTSSTAAITDITDRQQKKQRELQNRLHAIKHSTQRLAAERHTPSSWKASLTPYREKMMQSTREKRVTQTSKDQDEHDARATRASIAKPTSPQGKGKEEEAAEIKQWQNKLR